MSREDVMLEGYEPGNGYQSALRGLSRRDWHQALGAVAFLMVVKLLESYLGFSATFAIIYAMFGAALLAAGIYQILRAERFEKGKTQKVARGVRIEGAVLVVVGAAVAISCSLCLWEGYAIDPLWPDLAYLALVLMALASWMFPALVRHLRSDGEVELEEAPISPRRRLVIGGLLVLIIGILCITTYMERIEALSPRAGALVFPATILLFGLAALAMPRSEEAEIDMRPAWLVMAVLLAIFFYFMFSV